MVPDFKLVVEAPEHAFLGCGMATNEEIVARELEANQKLVPGDIKVTKSFKDGRPYFAVYARIVRLIDCSKDRSWIDAVEESLTTEQAFEVLNLMPSDIAHLEPVFGPYADWWQWSDRAEPTARRSFRPIAIPEP